MPRTRPNAGSPLSGLARHQQQRPGFELTKVHFCNLLTSWSVFDICSVDYLKKHDDPRNLRFISDQVRHEVNSEGYART